MSYLILSLYSPVPTVVIAGSRLVKDVILAIRMFVKTNGTIYVKIICCQYLKTRS